MSAAMQFLRSSIQRGFTIIEILIAIVVLVLGITGILALFPTAINSGNQTVEDTYASAITQSVVDAVTVGLRESRYTWAVPSTGEVWTYFIFNHDGVLDAPPTKPEDLENATDSMWKKDYCVILPRSKVAGANSDRTQEPAFIFPVPNQNGSDEGTQDDQRNPLTKLAVRGHIDNLADKYRQFTTVEGSKALWISRVYPLGRYRNGTPGLPAGVAPGDVRLEYRGETLVNPASTVQPEAIAIDPYANYGFCFTLKRARVDSNGDGQVSPGPNALQPGNPPADNFSDNLYELRVMVFKNFNQGEANALAGSIGATGVAPVVPKTNVPIKSFVTLISL
ncbi:MAG: prepilin-type N-terminal cleavage/methylation domain-containing protein [Planctomycetota bacterium]|nr:MAG: prepilin-type N-terminal cleavage/methylation domain-containing protein [Planctomycetota bacterium]